jgi:hypothetical protein
MVTKRVLGAKKGRPEKPKIKAPKRTKGRPKKPLADDPERYLKAYIQASIDYQEWMESQGLISEKTSANKIAKYLLGIRHGRLPQGERHIITKNRNKITAEQNRAAMVNNEAFYVYAEPQNGAPVYRHVDGTEWRDTNTWHASAHNLLTELRRTREAPLEDSCRYWLAAMSMVWTACFRGDVSFAHSAERLTDAIGERIYFEAVMRPVMDAQATLRAAGLGSIPMAGWLSKACTPNELYKLTR